MQHEIGSRKMVLAPPLCCTSQSFTSLWGLKNLSPISFLLINYFGATFPNSCLGFFFSFLLVSPFFFNESCLDSFSLQIPLKAVELQCFSFKTFLLSKAFLPLPSVWMKAVQLAQPCLFSPFKWFLSIFVPHCSSRLLWVLYAHIHTTLK